jgi:hypothetical protein
MKPSTQAENWVIEDAKTLWQKLTSAYQSKMKLKNFEMRKDHWTIMLEDRGDVNNYPLRINQKVKDYNLSAEPTAPSTTHTDAKDMGSAKSVAKFSGQERIFKLLRGIPIHKEWKVFLELMMDKTATIHAIPHEIVTKLVQLEATTK